MMADNQTDLDCVFLVSLAWLACFSECCCCGGWQERRRPGACHRGLLIGCWLVHLLMGWPLFWLPFWKFNGYSSLSFCVFICAHLWPGFIDIFRSTVYLRFYFIFVNSEEMICRRLVQRQLLGWILPWNSFNEGLWSKLPYLIYDVIFTAVARAHVRKIEKETFLQISSVSICWEIMNVFINHFTWFWSKLMSYCG